MKGFLENKWIAWLLLALLFLVLDFGVVGMNRWEFYYGLVYALLFLGIVVISAFKKTNWLAAGAVSVMSVAVIGISDGFIPAMEGLIFASALFVTALIGQFAISKSDLLLTKILEAMPFVGLLGYYITGIYLNLAYTGPSLTGVLWIFTRGGIAVLAVDGIVKVTGMKRKALRLLMPLGLLLAIIGALYLTLPSPMGLGRGLNLLT